MFVLLLCGFTLSIRRFEEPAFGIVDAIAAVAGVFSMIVGGVAVVLGDPEQPRPGLQRAVFLLSSLNAGLLRKLFYSSSFRSPSAGSAAFMKQANEDLEQMRVQGMFDALTIDSAHGRSLRHAPIAAAVNGCANAWLGAITRQRKQRREQRRICACG